MDTNLSKLWEIVKDRHGSLACCSPWGHKELDRTYQLKDTRTLEQKEYCRSYREGGLLSLWISRHWGPQHSAPRANTHAHTHAHAHAHTLSSGGRFHKETREEHS